nr:F40F12.2 protein - Caenorhabditis elegans [Caenorhabditis elegans]
MERIICSRIRTEFSHLLSPHQHGFLQLRSCPSSLVRSITLYHSIIRQEKSLDIIFFDFAKAFDKVSHSILLKKLATFGLDPLTCSWFKEFLNQRTFSVKINRFLSKNTYPISSGVPQGSVSGPLLFILFINDLLIDLEHSIYVSCFADDIKIYHHNPLIIQQSIDTIVSWSKKNELPLAPAKSSSLSLGSLNTNHSYTVDGVPIIPSSTVRDLGLVTDPKLKFEAHIAKISSLAMLRAKQILKAFSSNSPHFYGFLFKTYVAPIINYCAEVYSPSPNSLLSTKLEKPLRHFTKRVLQRCNTKFSSYEDRLSIMKLFSTRHTRIKAQMKLLYRFLTGSSHFPRLNQFVSFASSNRHPMILVRKDSCTAHFFAQSVPIWNNLFKNVPVFLSPFQFSHFLDLHIPRY